MHDVFISYSFENKALADRICHHLEQNHVRCWYAPRDVSPGMDYREAIMAAIQESKCLVLIYTKASNRSRDVRNEITAAFLARCPILPFRVDDIRMEPSLAYYLNGVHWLDAVVPPMDQRIQELLETIVAIMNKTTPLTRAVPPAETDPRPFGTQRAASNVFSLQKLSESKFYRYPFFLDLMFSQDGEMHFLENTKTRTLSLVKTGSGDILQENIALPTEHPEAVSSLVTGGYDVIYFMENLVNGNGRAPVIRIFDRKRNVWVCKNGIQLTPGKTKSIQEGLYSTENKAFRKDVPDALNLLVYDSAEGVDCYTDVVTINPDGTVRLTDISGLGLIRFLSGIKKPGSNCVLMLDRDMRLRLFDIATFSIPECSPEELRKEYLPCAVAADRILSRDGRFLLQTERFGDAGTVVILDLEKREERYRETFSQNYNMFFTEDGRALGYAYRNGEGTLISIDVETGRVTRLLDSAYFRREPAFLNVPFAAHYSEELSCCFFVSQSTPAWGKPLMAKVTMVSENGQVLCQSNAVEIPFQEGVVMLRAKNGKLFLLMADSSLGKKRKDRISTGVYFAYYNIHPDGTVEFLN